MSETSVVALVVRQPHQYRPDWVARFRQHRLTLLIYALWVFFVSFSIVCLMSVCD